MSDDEAGLEELRKPFPDGTVGVLPKPYKKDSPRGNCNVCGGYHGLPAAHLDFVGHAAVTDRLLSVDPGWTWAPMAKDERGLPALDREGNLWIELTVCGVTRVGVGDGPNMKERIGDALRNAAMRFGVALSLWTKDELESGHVEATAVGGSPDAQQDAPRAPQAPAQQSRRETHSTVRSAPRVSREPQETGEKATQPQIKAIFAITRGKGITATPEWLSGMVGRDVDKIDNLSKREASDVIKALNEAEEDAAVSRVEQAFEEEPEF